MVKKQQLIALALLVAVLGWMFIPRSDNTAEEQYEIASSDDTRVTAVSADSPTADDNTGFIVRASQISAQNFVERVRVRGRTQAFRHVEIRAEESGRVVATPFARGARVEEGEVLCELAVDTRETDLQEARSRRDQAQLEYEAELDLERQGLQSRVAIAQARAALDSAIAAVERAALALERTNIRAPFGGIMETRSVEVGDLLERGGNCASLLDDSPMLLTGQVPEQEVAKAVLGAPVQAELTTGGTVQGRLTYIARAADAVTRSYRIEVEIDETAKPIRQGVTAEIYLAASTIRAHYIPASALTLNDAGATGVKTLDQENRVHFVEVEIVGEVTGVKDPGIWVTGLPEQATVITHGQEIVFPGQTVQASFDWSTR